MPHGDSIDPLAQLERCHRRLEEACSALTVAVEKHDIETVSDVASFLARQIKRHEDDEDKTLFPRLASNADLGADIARLGEEHVLHGALQQRLDDALSGRIDPSIDQWTELGAVAGEIVRSYRDHIALEESRIFPAARASLTEDDLAAMRSEMDARRGR